MTRLKLVSTKISADWVDRLEEYTKLTGLTQSALVRKAIGQYLGLETVDPVDPVDPLRSEIEAIKARLSTLERLTRLTMVDPPPIVVTKSSTPKPKPPNSTSTPPKLMRSGELLIALQARGYKRSAGSLLRDLNQSIENQAPNDELSKFGVRCDFEAKRLANPRSSNLRWLWIED